MNSTATIVVVLVCAFLLGVKLTVDLVRHRRRKGEFGSGDVRYQDRDQRPQSAKQDRMEVNSRSWRAGGSRHSR
jgi:hypothetical protein